MIEENRFFIGGQWVAPLSGTCVAVADPATEEVFGRAMLAGTADADRAVAAALAAFPAWSVSPVVDRKALLQRMRAAFVAAAPAIESLLIREIGLTRMVAGGQTAMCLAHFDTALDLLDRYAFAEDRGGGVEVVREPVGVVVAITSWNAPVSQMLCKAVPAIAAGCTVVVKPSELAPLCGMALARALEPAGIPAGVFNLLNGDGGNCGRRLVEHPDVAMVSFTGSVGGGGRVAALAAPTIKRVHQELGGKSANILLPDADFAKAVPASVIGCMMNAGQVCAAPTRLLVPQDRWEDVATLAREAAARIVVGAPDADGVTYGPLSNRAQFDRVRDLLRRARAQHTPELVSGGECLTQFPRGFYMNPTIFGPVDPDALIAQEEVFGPVLCIHTYRDEDEAVAIANATPFGLAAYVQSGDPAAARRVAARLRAGYVTVNFPRWTPAAPFGGYGRSGNGRQYGVWGFEEFLEIKSIVQN